MRLYNSLVFVAATGIAVATADQAAEVFLLTAKSQPQNTEHVPSLPKEIARNIFLQRTATGRHGTSLSDIPNSMDEEMVLRHIAEYGTTIPSLFEKGSNSPPPSQLVVLLEGIDDSNSAQLREALTKAGHQPAFTIADAPSAVANERFLSYFRAAGISKTPGCGVAAAVDPFDEACWSGTSSFVKYDAQQDPELIHTLLDTIPNLSLFVSSGHLEVALVLLPESSRHSKLNSWASSPAVEQHTGSELRRRELGSEHVMTSTSLADAASTLPIIQQGDAVFANKIKSVPACFASADKCTSGTNSCSGHGSCVNKYGNDSDAACFVCQCKETVEKTGDEPGAIGRKVTHWGGAMCQKEDVSVQFWLLAFIAVLLAGGVAFAIGLLFSVGEEELPGVIGAGVSRNGNGK